MVKNLVIAALSIAVLVLAVLLFRAPDPTVVEKVVVVAPDPDAPVEPVAPLPEPDPVPPPDPRLMAIGKALDEGEAMPGMRGAVLGFCLIGPDGEVLYERRGDLAQIPASSLKTLTTATALEVLGPDFRFRTRLGVSAPAEGAAKTADLILLGGGDPMLSYADLESWAKGLAEAGVTTIPGRIIGDGRFFPGSVFADFWNWGDIGNGYGSPVSGLNLEHNRFAAVFAPGEKEGDPTTFVGALPEIPGVVYWNETTTAGESTGDGVVVHGGERTGVMHFRGTVPMGEEFSVRGAVPDPERFAAHHLRLALLAAGIVVAGEAHGAGELFLKQEPVPVIADELLVHDSPPLIEIVKSIHATSDNHETECLYRMLGVQAAMPSEDVVRRHWEQRGLDLAGLRLVDGSGLARADHITPRTLARLQHLAAGGPSGGMYVDSLPATAGGAIRFKAGAMSAVRSYAGLVETDQGRLSFALMMNHYTSGGEANEIQGAVFGALLGETGEDVPEEEAEEKEEPEPISTEKVPVEE
jgi:D-alanyl-D-alanine carboxypeptidase/D-alanyl-D-alanine-endopeptidase (penicillin-binding protein 4)